MNVTEPRIRAAITGLLADRVPPKTICPSEAARALAPDAWRPLMPQVRAVAVDMAKDGLLEIRQGGQPVAPGASLRGPIRLGHAHAETSSHPSTPDGRYFVVRGRLWRKSNPHLPAAEREALVKQLMDARRAMRGKPAEAQRRAAKEKVESAKRGLGERGPVWWTDGAPDFNRKMAVNTPYKDWYLAQVA